MSRVLLVLAVAGSILATSCGNSLNKSNWRAAGSAFRVGKAIARAWIVPVGRGFSSMVELHLIFYNLADLSQQRDVLLGERVDRSKLDGNARVLGFDGQHTWLYGATLHGVNMMSGAVIGIDQLNAANPEMAGAWMNESKYGRVDRVTGHLELTASDGRKFTIEPTTLKATAVAEVKSAPSLDAADYRRKLDQYDEAMAMTLTYTASDFYYAGEMRSDDEYIGLMTDEEAAEPSHYWSVPKRLYKNELRRKLYRLKIETTHDERGTRSRKKISAEPLGNETFIKAGLVRDPRYAKAMRLQNPDGYLVLHQYRLDGPVVAARLDLTGKKVWEWNLGTQQLQFLYPDRDYLAIDMDSGNLASLDLATGSFKSVKLP